MGSKRGKRRPGWYVYVLRSLDDKSKGYYPACQNRSAGLFSAICASFSPVSRSSISSFPPYQVIFTSQILTLNKRAGPRSEAGATVMPLPTENRVVGLDPHKMTRPVDSGSLLLSKNGVVETVNGTGHEGIRLSCRPLLLEKAFRPGLPVARCPTVPPRCLDTPSGLGPPRREIGSARTPDTTLFRLKPIKIFNSCCLPFNCLPLVFPISRNPCGCRDEDGSGRRWRLYRRGLTQEIQGDAENSRLIRLISTPTGWTRRRFPKVRRNLGFCCHSGTSLKRVVNGQVQKARLSRPPVH